MNIGEASAFVSLLHFVNPQSGDRPSVEEVKAHVVTLRDRAAKALQVSGPHILSDADVDEVLRLVDYWVECWIEDDSDGDEPHATEHITDIDTHGRT